MGTVEVALERAEKGSERVVALKRLLPEGARDPRRKEMFLREARLATLVTHPNVAHAFAYGNLQGELFMAMEYVEGERYRMSCVWPKSAMADSRRCSSHGCSLRCVTGCTRLTSFETTMAEDNHSTSCTVTSARTTY